MAILALAVVVFGFSMAWLCSRHSRSPFQSFLFVLGGLLAGSAIYLSDRNLRGQTLAEAMLEGSQGVSVGAPAPLRTLTFEVEHAQVQHELMLSPYSPGSPSGPVELSLEVKDREGSVLLSDRRIYAVRGGGRNGRSHWEAAYLNFTPRLLGEHRLEVHLFTVEIPQVHVRIADPLKKDGQRIPGY